MTKQQACGTAECPVNTARDFMMEKYEEIITKINANDSKSIERHNDTHERISHLTQSIESFVAGQEGFIDSIKRAFPKDDDGKPDYEGHRSAHLSWISDSKASKELKIYIQKVVLGAAAVALLSWLWAVVWPAFLQGQR